MEDLETDAATTEEAVDTGGAVEAPATKTEPTVDRADLERNVAAGLAALTADETPAAEVAPADGVEEKPGEEKPAEATKQDEEEAATKTEEKPTETPAPKSDVPTLPAAYRRSLKAYDWTDEEIDAAVKDTPNFVATAAKIHQNRNAELSKWAEAGRAARSPATTATTPAASDPLAALRPVDAASLKLKYGDEPIINDIVGPVNAAIAAIQKMMPAVELSQQRSQQAELETIGRQVNNFFASDDLKTYREMYGTASDRSEGQEKARIKVLEHADALMSGAKQQGRTLTVDEALTLAHDSLSSGYTQKAVREQIAGQLKQRAKGVTLKPGGKAKAAATGKPGDRAALESRVKANLAAAFG